MKNHTAECSGQASTSKYVVGKLLKGKLLKGKLLKGKLLKGNGQRLWPNDNASDLQC